ITPDQLERRVGLHIDEEDETEAAVQQLRGIAPLDEEAAEIAPRRRYLVHDAYQQRASDAAAPHLRQRVDAHHRRDVFVEADVAAAGVLPAREGREVAAPAALLFALSLRRSLGHSRLGGLSLAIEGLAAAVLVAPHRLPGADMLHRHVGGGHDGRARARLV